MLNLNLAVDIQDDTRTQVVPMAFDEVSANKVPVPQSKECIREYLPFSIGIKLDTDLALA
jgi:hypothetical protein